MKTGLMALTLAWLQLSLAAIPRKTLSVEEALRQDGEERISTLKKIGPQGYRDLHSIAFDPNKSYDLRWRAVISMAWLGDKESIIDLERAIQDRDWFLRDAALKAFKNVDSKKAIYWAKQMLGDPALVVRSSAVQTIKDLHDTEAEALLWEKINSSENFRGQRGLFIRRQILQALVELASNKSEEKFIPFLADKDKSLHHLAVEGIERTSGIRKDEDPRKSLLLWRKVYAKQLLKD